MAVYEVSRHRPKVVYCFTGIRKWVVRLWKRSFWFSKKVNVTLSLNWSMPYQRGCSQFLISSRGFDSSICDWKNKFSLFGKYKRYTAWIVALINYFFWKMTIEALNCEINSPTKDNEKNMWACCRYTRGHFERTHGDVLNAHTGEGRGGSSPVLLTKMAHVGLSLDPREVRQKQPLDLTHLRVGWEQDVTDSFNHSLYQIKAFHSSSPEGNVLSGMWRTICTSVSLRATTKMSSFGS